MNLGQLLGGAGVVGSAWRAEEESQRVARQNQLAIEEQNRLADLKARMAQAQVPSFQPVDVAQFTSGLTAPKGVVMPEEQVSAPVVPSAPTAGRGQINPPMAFEAQPEYGVGFGPGAGRGTMTPPMMGQLSPDAQKARELMQMRMMRVRDAQIGLERLASGNAPANMLENQKGVIAREAALLRAAQEGFDAVVAREASTAALAAPAAPAAPAVQPTAATTPVTPESLKALKTARSYDEAATPYNALIAQSAQQYGIDPVAFKRLIGTESSFRPDAVSSRGEKYGLGIAQIADVHNLSREQRLDPNVAIPFAAQLFAKYLQQTGGNYEQALLLYKGASSPEGKAAMAKPISTITAGLAPSKQTSATPLEAPATTKQHREMAERYLANPESIPFEYQQLTQIAQQQAALMTQQRNETARLAQMYMQSGTSAGIESAMKLRDSVMKMDNELLALQQRVQDKQMYLQGMQSLRELATANDPRRLSGVLSSYMGVPVGIQPRSDGNYNYFVNGKKVRENISPELLAAMAMQEFSPEARADAAASNKLERELALKRKYGDAMVNAMRDIQKAMVEGEYKLADERAKQAHGKLTVDTTSNIAYFQIDNQVFIITPKGEIKETPLGQVTTPPAARAVVGIQ